LVGPKGWKVRLSSLVSLCTERGLPRLVVHEKYQRAVKWVLRALALAGIAGSAVSLPPVVSVAVALCLAGVEQFFERAVFEYSTIYAIPPPDFPYRQASWIEMLYMIPTDPRDVDDPAVPSVCGLVFDDWEQAHGVSALVQSWATGPDGSGADNIVLSFVDEDDEGYSVHMYPDLSRRGLDEIFEETRQLQLEEKIGKRQQRLVFYVRLGKYFKCAANSKFDMLANRQEALNAPYVLGVFVKQDGRYIGVDESSWVSMTRWRHKRRDDLSKGDPEWEDARTTRWRRRSRQRERLRG
jgi:hypothetical protein